MILVRWENRTGHGFDLYIHIHALYAINETKKNGRMEVLIGHLSQNSVAQDITYSLEPAFEYNLCTNCRIAL